MWHKGGLLHACSITDFNIPVVGIHSLQVNTSKHCNKEKKASAKNVLETKGVHAKRYIFYLPFSPFKKHGTQRYFLSLPTKRQSFRSRHRLQVAKRLLQKVESSSTFCNKICTSCTFYRTKETCFAASDVTPVYGVIPALLGTLRNHDDDGNGNVKKQ